MNKYFKLLNEKFSKLIEEDEKDSQLLATQEDDLLTAVDLKDYTKDATKIVEDKNWEIWKPKSEEGMVLLSQGTKWLSSHSWNAPDVEFGEVNPESWNFQNWGKAYVIISKDKIDRVTGFPKKFLFQAGWGGMYSPSYARYSFASWILKQNSPKLIKWAAESKFPYVSNRLLGVAAANELEKSGGVYTYPSNVYPSWSERGNVTKIVIKPGTTRINAHAFSNFEGITEVEIPDTVTVISNYAFSRMRSLNSIKLPPNLTTIGEGVFEGCSNLTTIIIPNKVRKIGESAFANCTSLKTLFIPNSVKTMGIILKQWSRETTLPNLTIYCEAPSKPEGWDENWNATYAGETWEPGTQKWIVISSNKVEKVIWGASKPTVTEELKKNINEEDEDLLTLVNDVKVLYEDSQWKILKSVTFDSIIKYAGSDKVGVMWAESIMPTSLSNIIDGDIKEKLKQVETDFYNPLYHKKRPYVIIANKNNKINYLFYMSGNSGMSTAELLSNESTDVDFEKFIKNKSIDFQNWFKKYYSSLAPYINSFQQQQKVLKEYGGVYEYPKAEKIERSDKEYYTKIIIKEGTNKIEDYAFLDFENVKSVRIPESVSVIGDGAFEGLQNLSSIFLPKNVKIIGKEAFNYCFNLKKIMCEAPSKPEGWNESWNVIYENERWDPTTQKWIKFNVEKVKKVIWGASRPTVNEEKETLNEESDDLLTAISDRKVLLDNPKWKVVRVLSPEAYKEFIKKDNHSVEGRLNHLLSVDAEDFYSRTRGAALYVLIDKQNDDRYLFSPKIYGYTIVGYNDYYNNIMDFLKDIGTDEALQNWFKINFTATTRNIQKLQDTQAEITKRKYTYVYPDDEPIQQSSVAELIQVVTIKEGTTEIADYAFKNFKSVKEIIIPKSVKKIGKYAFEGCRSLISIVIPEGVTKIEENTFWACRSLEKVTLPSTITEIGDQAFWSCDKLWEINIPRSVTKIDQAAFLGCHVLSEVFIPASVQTIGAQALEIRNDYYDVAGYGKATIYCEAQSKPTGWNDNWTTSEVEVIWGAKPSLREEKEVDLEVMPYAKPEFEADGWVVMSIGTRAAPVQLANGKVFDWDPVKYTAEQNEEALTDDGYVFFSFKPNGATVEDIYLYEPMYPNDINIYQGGSVPMSNLLNYAESDKLRKWVINKFPEYKDDMIEHMVGYMVF